MSAHSRALRAFHPIFVALLAASALVPMVGTQVQGQPQQEKKTHAMKDAHVYRAGSLTVETPWTRATPGGAAVAGGYLKITNHGSAADRLVGGSSDVAGRFEVHEMSVTDGVMKMRPVTGGLEVAPGATVELKPGGLHAMLMGLKRGLKAGETVKGTLEFEKAGTVEIEYQVQPIGAGAPGGTKDHAPKHSH